ncbi:type VI secretion system ATPase TssH [Marinibaculum pumilum]|uniref:Type VI secretion system ATPase TssH n=1 Tax=Marinibaculum pumilum TaxID=1766165 RepID=A0ABV7L4G7_9PROT
MATDIKQIVGKLNQICYKALNDAAHLSVSQTNFQIEIEHLLIKLIAVPGCDVEQILKHYDCKVPRVESQLQEAIESFKRGSGARPSFSPQFLEMLEAAWRVTSLTLAEEKIRSGAILLAIMEDRSLRASLLQSAPELERLSPDRLRVELSQFTPHTIEAVAGAGGGGGDGAAGSEAGGAPGAPGGGTGGTAPSAGGGEKGGGKALDAYTIDMTAQAKAGKTDVIIGREGEIRQMIDILMRRRQNNPIIVGEAGVGKTALVEGLANRIAEGDVPPPLKNVVLRSLDLGLLQAGAGVRGEFEDRLKKVINEVKTSPKPIILFIDEAHTLIGAGGQAGSGDAANLLKPALARGELRTIGATTWSEYKKHIEKDPALTRRFQTVNVAEPDEEKAVRMLSGLLPSMEKHHKVRILEEALRDAVRLSRRYIMGRQLPDKAISVLDTACARVAIAQASQPAELEGVVHRLHTLNGSLRAMEKQLKAGLAKEDEVNELRAEIERLDVERIKLEGRYKQEADLVVEINKLMEEIEKDETTGKVLDELRSQLNSYRLQLETLQAARPMVMPYVNGDVVAQVISGWTGIPVGKMMTDEINGILRLEDRLAERIIGQKMAIRTIAERMQASKAGLNEPNKPTGVFLLVGPSGVGKTETAITLADLLYGGEDRMVTINMSEYQEAHTVAGLKGAPPGYVGYGTGGVLTEAVRRNPYSVVLLDEFEKAHPDVWELFYQVFDKGMLEDSEGQAVNFKNTLILLTSNLASDIIMEACTDVDEPPPADELTDMIRPVLAETFKPALLGRMSVTPFYPLTPSEIGEIARLKLGKIQRRFAESHKAELTYDAALIDHTIKAATDVASGARTIDGILNNTLLPQLSTMILQRMADEQHFERVHVQTGEDGTFDIQFS